MRPRKHVPRVPHETRGRWSFPAPIFYYPYITDAATRDKLIATSTQLVGECLRHAVSGVLTCEKLHEKIVRVRFVATRDFITKTVKSIPRNLLHKLALKTSFKN